MGFTMVFTNVIHISPLFYHQKSTLSRGPSDACGNMVVLAAPTGGAVVTWMPIIFSWSSAQLGETLIFQKWMQKMNGCLKNDDVTHGLIKSSKI